MWRGAWKTTVADLRLTPPCPGAPVTQNFGDGDLGYAHRGTDFGVPIGTPVYAPCDGVVVDFLNSWTTWNGQQVRSFGNGVCIWHRDTGLYVLLAHLSRVDVVLGQEVSQEQQVGLSGNTGVSTGPHLHLQVCANSQFPTDINQSRNAMAYWHPEDVMTPEDRKLLNSIAQVLTGAPTPQGAQMALDQELARGANWEMGNKIVWNNLWRHLNAQDGLHSQPVWRDF